MKERPIIFSTPMVKAILDGRKTQTRRVIKDQPPLSMRDMFKPKNLKCPYGQVGDRLWVRETFKPYNCMGGFAYKADGDLSTGFPWKPSIHMPRGASRITLEITESRAERLQDISEEDAKAEGVKCCPNAVSDYKHHFMILWDSINGKKYPWDSNPWVWVISFKVVR